ncbi:MAG: D-alanine--D-alanine ligase [Xanthomonadales bacterium]|nr:D-alanine--D-alanine ligase [Xanthomonadales bacterium]
MFGRVAVLMGGPGSEREVSLQSGAGVLEALHSRGVDAFAVDGIPALVDAIRDGRVDRVFNILHGRGGEDGVLQGALRALDVPFTGCGVLGAALSMDKLRSKQVWQSLDLPTARYAVFHPQRGEDLEAAIASVGLPVVIKPSREGSSVGISRVFDASDVPAAIELAARYDGELLIERLIVGDELTVAVLDGEALPSIRIVPAGEYYDYHAKYVADDTQYLCPGIDDTAAEAALRELAARAASALDVDGWCRVDVMRDRDGGFWLLEVNTAPGMTTHSLVPKAAAVVGIDYPSLCWRILESTVLEGTVLESATPEVAVDSGGAA